MRERERKKNVLQRPSLDFKMKRENKIISIHRSSREAVIQPTKSFFSLLSFSSLESMDKHVEYMKRAQTSARSITKQTRFRSKISFIHIYIHIYRCTLVDAFSLLLLTFVAKANERKGNCF